MKNIFAVALLLLSFTTLAFAAQATDEWMKFTSEAGRLSVLLPAKPEESTDSKDSAHGPYTVHMFTSKGSGELYLLGWVDYDPNFNFDTQAELEANRDNFVNGIKATLLDTKKIMLGDNPGLEFTAKTDDAFFTSRVYIVGRRPYQLVAVSLGSTASPNTDKFLSSFQVSVSAK